jgi:PmbA protein
VCSSDLVSSIKVFASKVDSLEINDNESYSVRAIYNGKVSSFSFQNPMENDDYILKTLLDNACSNDSVELTEIFSGSEKYLEAPKRKYDINSKTKAEKVELILQLEKQVLAKDKRVAQVNYCIFNETSSQTEIFNSKGLKLQENENYALIYCNVIFKDGETVNTNDKVAVFTTYDEFNAVGYVEELVKEGIDKLYPVDPTLGTVSVVIKNAAFANILANFAPQFSGEQLLCKLTPLDGKVGEVIASAVVNLTEEPVSEKALAASTFDYEGVATTEKTIVANGVFKGFIHDLKTAKAFNQPPTGNSFHGITFTNLVLQDGDRTLDELCASINDGLLITSVWAFHAGANLINGVFNIPASGYVIKNGKIGGAISQVVLSGSFNDLLLEIEEVGNDSKWFTSGVTSPSVKVKKLVVSK